ncbi:MAG: sodium/proline symporter [Bacteroidales bacterium]|nr:sodium/proline symporter [Bacteroidales bacterium]
MMTKIELLSPIFIYFIIIVAIGIYASRFSSKGISEYFIGGRQMGRLVVALSAVVSGRSAWLLLGVSGLAYLKGITAIWAVIGYIVVEFLLFIYYAPRIRRFSEQNDCITLTDFYAARFNDKSGVLRILIVTIFIVFMVTYVSSQFVAGGKAFTAHLGISGQSGLLITALIILIYTILGGFLAVSLTDVFQAVVMMLALVGLPLTGIFGKGGIENTIMELQNIDSDMLNLFRQPALAILGLAGIGLGSPGNPHIIVRYMSIKDHTQFRWTAVVGTFWNIIMAAGAIGIGLVGRTYFPSPGLLPEGDQENIYVSLANLLMNPFLAGLIIASVFAAIMSTADSQLLIAASSIVRDIYEKLIRRGNYISQKQLTRLSRIVVLIIVIVAVILAFSIEEQILWFVLFAWAGLGAAIGPTSLLALFWKQTTKAGVIGGLIAGSATVFIWKGSRILSNALYELIPGFFMALLVTILISLLTGRKKESGV